jgi:KUP system potassium uptake protein
VTTVPGTAIYMFKDPGSAPPALLSNLRHNRVLHETTIVLSILVSDAPHVPPDERIAVARNAAGAFEIVLTFGFVDEADVVDALRDLDLDGRRLDPDTATFFIGRETVTSTEIESMPRWREHLFVQLNRGAASASRFYKLPAEQVFEVGTQVDI